MSKNDATCFCGTRHEERAVCRHCGSVVMRHDEPGLMGWFAYDLNAATYADGDCSRDAMNAMHSPAVMTFGKPLQPLYPTWERTEVVDETEPAA